MLYKVHLNSNDYFSTNNPTKTENRTYGIDWSFLNTDKKYQMTYNFLSTGRLLEFPPVALPNLTTEVQGEDYGNGIYKVNASSVYDTNDNNRVINAFDKETNDYAWVSANNSYSTINGFYNRTTPVTTSTNSGNINGEWLQIELPSAIFLNKIRLGTRTLGAYSPPLGFTLVANNNVNDTWVKIFETANTLDPLYSGDGVWSAGELVTIDINSTINYKNYRIIVQRVAPYPSYQRYCAIGDFELYGTAPVASSSIISINLGSLGGSIQASNNTEQKPTHLAGILKSKLNQLYAMSHHHKPIMIPSKPSSNFITIDLLDLDGKTPLNTKEPYVANLFFDEI